MLSAIPAMLEGSARVDTCDKEKGRFGDVQIPVVSRRWKIEVWARKWMRKVCESAFSDEKTVSERSWRQAKVEAMSVVPRR